MLDGFFDGVGSGGVGIGNWRLGIGPGPPGPALSAVAGFSGTAILPGGSATDHTEWGVGEWELGIVCLAVGNIGAGIFIICIENSS